MIRVRSSFQQTLTLMSEHHAQTIQTIVVGPLVSGPTMLSGTRAVTKVRATNTRPATSSSTCARLVH